MKSPPCLKPKQIAGQLHAVAVLVQVCDRQDANHKDQQDASCRAQEITSAARSRADRELGFCATSSGRGRTGFGVNNAVFRQSDPLA